MDATLRFLDGAAKLPDVDLSIVSQDPADKLPAAIRARIAGHWRIADALNPEQLAGAAIHHFVALRQTADRIELTSYDVNGGVVDEVTIDLD